MKNNLFETIIAKAGSIPGIKIDREDFLRKTFRREDEKKIDEIIMCGPIKAGIPMNKVSELANQSIRAEALQTTAISAGTGVFGGPIAMAAIPGDLIQFYGHVFRIVQKLMYLYDWEEDIFDEDGELDDATRNVLVLYIGLMFGVEAAGKLLAQIASVAAQKDAAEVPMRVLKAFVTKQAFREVIKKIIKTIGIKALTKYTIAVSSKVVPFVGALTSGALTAIFFIPMSKRLKKYLEKGELGHSEEENVEELYNESQSF